MREAMETAQQDRTAAPAELTVTWEEVCRYLDSLAARGRRRETVSYTHLLARLDSANIHAYASLSLIRVEEHISSGLSSPGCRNLSKRDVYKRQA